MISLWNPLEGVKEVLVWESHFGITESAMFHNHVQNLDPSISSSYFTLGSNSYCWFELYAVIDAACVYIHVHIYIYVY